MNPDRNKSPAVRMSFGGDIDEMFDAVNLCFLHKGAKIEHFLKLKCSPAIQVMRNNGFDTPTFIYAGPESGAAKFFGEEFARNCAGKAGVPDQEFALSLCDAYKELAWDPRKPILERLARTADDRTIQFERGLWAAESTNDTPVVVCFIKPLRVFREIPHTATLDLHATAM
ncbi:MAG: hypothetical protein GY948_11810 [Alphaproteobacteria bacterium]|nr:hypothetical protein [Alphaproteobacteria bacterium]